MPRPRHRIELQTLHQYFHVPINVAAQSLKISLTLLKKMCRQFGIQRWPYRKVRTRLRTIASLENKLECNYIDDDERDRLSAMMLDEKNAIVSLFENPLCTTSIRMRSRMPPLLSIIMSGSVIPKLPWEYGSEVASMSDPEESNKSRYLLSPETNHMAMFWSTDDMLSLGCTARRETMMGEAETVCRGQIQMMDVHGGEGLIEAQTVLARQWKNRLNAIRGSEESSDDDPLPIDEGSSSNPETVNNTEYRQNFGVKNGHMPSQQQQLLGNLEFEALLYEQRLLMQYK